MEKESTYYVELMNRYFAGEINPGNMTALSEWLKSSSENQKQFEEYRRIWDVIEATKIDSIVDLDEEWNYLSLKIGGIAEKGKELRIVSPEIKPIRKLNNFAKFLRIAATFLLLAVAGYVLYYYLKNDHEEPAMKRLVAKTKSIESKLPDGSSVTLNTGSMLDYPEKFKSDKRTVTLKGEAYFNVTPDKNRLFIIAADDIRVEVSGTSFYVNTNADNGNVEVILTSGKVEVYQKDKPSERTILDPGEKAEFSKADQKISKSENDDKNYMAFKTKKLVFYNTPLREVIEDLNKVYHSNIRISGEKLADCSVNSTVDANTVNLDGALKILDATLFIKITKSSSGIEISGDGCK